MPKANAQSRSTGKKLPAVVPRTPPHPLDTPWGAIVTVGLLCVGMVLMLALISYTPNDLPMWTKLSKTNEPNSPAANLIGVAGAVVAGCGYLFFGAATYLLAAAFCWFGLARLIMRLALDQRTIGGLFLLVLSGASLAHLHRDLFGTWNLEQNLQSPGGMLGFFFADTFQRLLGRIGSNILLLAGYLFATIMVMGFHPTIFFRLLRRAWFRHQQTHRPRVTTPGSPLLTPIPTSLTTRDPLILPPVEEKVIRRRGKSESKSAEETALNLPLGDDLPSATKPIIPSADPTPPPAEITPEPPKPKIIDGSARRPKSGRDRIGEEPKRLSTLGTMSFPNYELPPLDLLNYDDEHTGQAADEHALIATQDTIVETLSTFGVDVSPGDITRGPSITRYEIYPSKGLRVNRITSLEADIARATMAECINILAPIPGKDTVGIEIANRDRIPVPLRELLDDPAFSQGKAKLPLALGKDVYGNPVVADLAQMPHLLVAGTTGSGKSVCINSIIACLLFQYSPDQLRFIMIDPKVVEMQIYNSLPHLVVPVVTDPKKVILALRWVIREMERRYQIFAKVGKRNFDAFNKREQKEPGKPTTRAQSPGLKKPATVLSPMTADLPAELKGEQKIPASIEMAETDDPALLAAGPAEQIDNPPFFVHRVSIEETEEGDDLEAFEQRVMIEPGTENELEDDPDDIAEAAPMDDEALEIPESLPYIVVIIDELADLMQTAPADVEMCIARITQMARAAGIHLIVATQTPRADVITGVIKANIPSRIAFKVASGIDSRVILDAKGADRLVGKGDMLYLPPGSSQLIRVQGVLVSDEEIQRLVDFCGRQGDPAYESEVQDTLDGGSNQGGAVSDEDEEILEKCLEVIRQEKRASTSLMQRRLGLGYTRAARMMDILEERGYVGPGDGAKPREILVDL